MFNCYLIHIFYWSNWTQIKFFDWFLLLYVFMFIMLPTQDIVTILTVNIIIQKKWLSQIGNMLSTRNDQWTRSQPMLTNERADRWQLTNHKPQNQILTRIPAPHHWKYKIGIEVLIFWHNSIVFSFGGCKYQIWSINITLFRMFIRMFMIRPQA